MDIIPTEELKELTESCKLLDGSREAPGIMLDTDDNILKFFYPRDRIFTIKKFLPAASSFAANAGKLNKRGINTVSINGVMHCKDPKCYIVSYKKLPGEDFRHLYANRGRSALEPLPAFIAHLHDKGVFFRSIHLGNLLWQPDNRIALLDIQGTHFSLFKLDPIRRARNLSHLLNTKEDRYPYLAYGEGKFMEDYLHHANLSHWEQKLFILWFNYHGSKYNHNIHQRPFRTFEGSGSILAQTKADTSPYP